MPNTNLPPGWGNRSPSAKPNWGNPPKESPPKQKPAPLPQDAPAEAHREQKKTIQEPVPSEVSGRSPAVPPVEETEKTTTVAESQQAVTPPPAPAAPVREERESEIQGGSKSTKTPILVLCILLGIAVLAAAVLAFLYFRDGDGDGQGEQVTSETTATPHAVSEMEAETSAAAETTEAAETTAVTTTVESAETTATETTVTETTEAAAPAVNVGDYLGYWHYDSMMYERELMILWEENGMVNFSLWYHRLDSLDHITAVLEGDTAYFEASGIAGTLRFTDAVIVVDITYSERVMPVETMVFDGRHAQSWQTGDLETETVEVPYKGGLGEDGLGLDDIWIGLDTLGVPAEEQLEYNGTIPWWQLALYDDSGYAYELVYDPNYGKFMVYDSYGASYDFEVWHEDGLLKGFVIREMPETGAGGYYQLVISGSATIVGTEASYIWSGYTVTIT